MLHLPRKGAVMKILLAVDDSKHSDAAAEAVARGLWPPGSTVRVLSAYTTFIPIDVSALYAVTAIGPDLEKAARDQALAVVERSASKIRKAGLVVETNVEAGDARTVIVEEAAEWPADLIVVGSHGQGGLRRLLLGSVAQHVAAHAPC